ncbi:MAG: hypothetical protein AB1546_02675 [bacterium]
MNTEEFSEFIKENFRPIKTRENAPVKIGRRTYDWLLKKEKRTGLSHLTLSQLEQLIEKHCLCKVDFEDGYTYITNQDAEREMMVAYYSESAEHDNPMISTHLKPFITPGGKRPVADLPSCPDAEEYHISENAIRDIIGEVPQEITLTPAALTEKITRDVVIDAIDRNLVRYHYEDDEIHIVSQTEDPGDSPVHPLLLPKSLPGTEISFQELDVSQRTFLDGAYRDKANISSHNIEHKITRSDD